jgi:glutamate-1-semialdehyde 2,1-aminomutase
MPPGKVFTLAEMGEKTLHVIRTRKDVACVLVYPLQALHPNKAAPGDGSLVDSGRSAKYDREAYTAWLRKLREACTANGVVLIFDEVFLGFRLAPGGAQEYFGVKADMVTYGKTLGGGLPVGVVCGKREFMKRFREERPADICFARGTFNSHPYVMGAMQVFLERLKTKPIQTMYADLDATWNRRAHDLNQLLSNAGLPVRVENMSTVWTVSFTQPSRYNWMLQFYLRAERLALSWVGTGRLIFSLNFTEEDISQVFERFIQASEKMKKDGWWWQGPELSNKAIKRAILREIVKHRFGL